MAKWIIHSKYDVRQFCKSPVIEAETEEQAMQYYYDNVWAENKNIFVEQEDLDDSDEVLEVKQVTEGEDKNKPLT